MTTKTFSPASSAGSRDTVGWPVAGLFVDALARRDFTAMAACLSPHVRLRALVPPGPFEAAGVDAAMARFEAWFGGPDSFDVVDAAIGQVQSKVYLRWLVRMRSVTAPDTTRLAEQHVFATVGDRIESLDLLCSGFQACESDGAS